MVVYLWDSTTLTPTNNGIYDQLNQTLNSTINNDNLTQQQTTNQLILNNECICSDLQHDDYSPLYAWFNYIVIIIMLPSLSVFGIVTNILNVFIYSRKRLVF